MILSDGDIRAEIERGDLVVDPIPGDVRFQPCGLDLLLGMKFLEYTADMSMRYHGICSQEILTARDSGTVEEIVGAVSIIPGGFFLGSTVEKVRLPAHLCAFVNGKSSWGRRGLMVHSTAGFIDPGFYGNITLELKNINPHRIITINPEDAICQIIFCRLSSPSMRPYGRDGIHSHYQGSVGTVPGAKIG